MLLRRVTQHLQEQNWFAVFVDFLIVVVGVFVGLQVQDWNDARNAREEERTLLQRLHEETRGLLEVHVDEVAGLDARAANLVSVNPVLFAQEDSRPLSDDECWSIAASHALRRPPDGLPVLEEMMMTGSFALLRDVVVKDVLRGYLQLQERSRAYFTEATNELFRLHSRFPELIRVSRVPATHDGRRWGGLSGEGFQWSPGCDIGGMRTTPAFLNEYADNVSRINSLTRLAVERRDHLADLERLLADRLDRKAAP